MAVLGANGSGKTTLLLHLNGTFRPTRGELRLDGDPVAYDRRSLDRWRGRVGLVLQEPDDQIFAATVEQDVSFGPLNLGLADSVVRERVNGALAALQIADLAARATHSLSFGQRSGWPSPACWRCDRNCWCWTNRPPASTVRGGPPAGCLAALA